MNRKVIAIIAGFVAFNSALVGGFYYVDKNVVCPRFADATDLESKYDFFAGGCFVNYEGQWIAKDTLRGGKLD